MGSLNKKVARRKNGPVTHEGAPAIRFGADKELRRAVMACLLWEDQFYESGVDIAQRIAGLVPQVEPGAVARMAIEARQEMNLRHVPLLLAREMARHPKHRGLVGGLLPQIIQRADELGEFMAIYWKDKKQPVSKQVRIGLAAAFGNFNEYQFAKYRGRNASVSLRDVMFLVHPRPVGDAQTALFKAIADDTLPVPDTWETSLSGGADKLETWNRLITEKKLGGLATLRNLRNMQAAGVSPDMIRQAISQANYNRVLPFRFIAAVRYAPAYEPELEAAMLASLVADPSLWMPGLTGLLIDVSGSMEAPVSAKSDISRLDAASGLAMILDAVCEDVAIWTFSNHVVRVPAGRHGFALRDAVQNSQSHGGTEAGSAVRSVLKSSEARTMQRFVVITDEQSHDRVGVGLQGGNRLSWMLNVASYQNGVGAGDWQRVDGWSDAIVRYMAAVEAEKEKTAGTPVVHLSTD